MYHPHSQLDYRPDIDGLRAVAVLAVVFGHARFAGFDGGFVGVDVFFVISGYLITSLLLRNLERGTFSFAVFYERRIRRIIPASIVVLLATSLAAIFILPPRQLAEYGQSAVSASLFYSNFFFANRLGYFDNPAALRPLLHTWSLAVEEQFYIVWPAALYLACRWRFDRPRLALSIGMVALASLFIAQWMSARDAARYFFLPQSRIWELMIGALLALQLLPQLRLRWQREALSLAGMALIAIAIVFFSSATPFPSLWTLLPCLGAAAIIHAGTGGGSLVARILSLPPVVFVGLISYSLYLWHWPLFSLATSALGRHTTIAETVCLVFAAFALSALTWRFVEIPFRRHAGLVYSPRVYAGAAAAMVVTISVGLTFYLSGGLPGRIDEEAQRFYAASKNVNPLRAKCHTDGNDPAPAADCIVPAKAGNQNYDIMVWGDSHADALFPAAIVIGAKLGLRSRQVTKSGCPPLLGARRITRRPNQTSVLECAAFNEAVLGILKEHRPRLVILAGRWSLYSDKRRRNEENFLVDDVGQPLTMETSREVLKRSLSTTVQAINKLGVPVLLATQSPEFQEDANACFVRHRMFHADPTPCIRRSRSAAEEELARSTAIVAQVAQQQTNTILWRLDEALCDKTYCWAARDNVPLYLDDHHISPEAAREAGRQALPLVKSMGILGPGTSDSSSAPLLDDVGSRPVDSAAELLNKPRQH